MQLVFARQRENPADKCVVKAAFLRLIPFPRNRNGNGIDLQQLCCVKCLAQLLRHIAGGIMRLDANRIERLALCGKNACLSIVVSRYCFTSTAARSANAAAFRPNACVSCA